MAQHLRFNIMAVHVLTLSLCLWIRSVVISNYVSFYEEKAATLFGTMGHELFQAVLSQKKSVRHREGMNRIIQRELHDVIAQHRVKLLSIGETEDTAKQRLTLFIPNLLDFFKSFVDKDDGTFVDWGYVQSDRFVLSLETCSFSLLSMF